MRWVSLANHFIQSTATFLLTWKIFILLIITISSHDELARGAYYSHSLCSGRIIEGIARS